MYELHPADPYKTKKIEVQQLGIKKVVIVRTPRNSGK